MIYPCPDCMFSTIPCAKHFLQPQPVEPRPVAGGNPGWQCPKCGRCWAPWVVGCQDCNAVRVTVTVRDNATVTETTPPAPPATRGEP